MMKSKIPALLLAACLIAACFAGCSDAGVRDYTGTDDNVEDVSPSPDTPEVTDDTAAAGYDYDAAYAAYKPDMVVMTIDGLDVTWAEYFYWLYNAVYSIEYSYGEIEDWDALLFGDDHDYTATDHGHDHDMTFRAYVQSYTLDILKQYRSLESNSSRLGASLSEEDRAYLEELWETDVANYGGGDEAAFTEYLESIYFSKDMYDYVNETSSMYMVCFEELYGENGEKLSDEDTLAFAEESGYMQVKHILIKTVDDAGAAFDEATVAQKQALAEDIISQINASADKNAKFDELMHEYSEDTGLLYYPDGYCFLEGEMVAEFEEASKNLEVGEFTQEPVASTYGYHIILRLPINPDTVVEYYSEAEQYTLRYSAALTRYDTQVGSWIDEAEVEYAPEFKDMDISKVFVKKA